MKTEDVLKTVSEKLSAPQWIFAFRLRIPIVKNRFWQCEKRLKKSNMVFFRELKLWCRPQTILKMWLKLKYIVLCSFLLSWLVGILR
jgi:hypothetical protein